MWPPNTGAGVGDKSGVGVGVKVKKGVGVKVGIITAASVLNVRKELLAKLPALSLDLTLYVYVVFGKSPDILMV